MADERERERLARFLARHAVSTREAVEADVAPYRGMTPAESWRILEELSRDVALQLALQPDAAVIALERDPPHPSYHAVMRRLRAEFLARERDVAGRA